MLKPRDCVLPGCWLRSVLGPPAVKPCWCSAEHMNERNRQAKRAQRECNDLFLLMTVHRSAAPPCHPHVLQPAKQPSDCCSTKKIKPMGALTAPGLEFRV